MDEYLNKKLFNLTESAIRSINAPRFFQTERGYQGQFYCALQSRLNESGLLENGAILEMEYQKSSRHGLYQRPDIVFHIPAEHSGQSVQHNNYAVWALKRRATEADAVSDFVKLDEMFEHLGYGFGVFLNIDSTDSMQQHYNGNYGDRLSYAAAKLLDQTVLVSLHSNAISP